MQYGQHSLCEPIVTRLCRRTKTVPHKTLLKSECWPCYDAMGGQPNLTQPHIMNRRPQWPLQEVPGVSNGTNRNLGLN